MMMSGVPRNDRREVLYVRKTFSWIATEGDPQRSNVVLVSGREMALY